MDAVKTGTTIRLEEVQSGDDGEKAYYNVCFTKFHILPLPRHVLTPVCSTYDDSSILKPRRNWKRTYRNYPHQRTADYVSERATCDITSSFL